MGVSPACGGKHHQGSGGQGTREPRRAGSESGVGDSTAPARVRHGSGTAPARLPPAWGWRSGRKAQCPPRAGCGTGPCAAVPAPWRHGALGGDVASGASPWQTGSRQRWRPGERGHGGDVHAGRAGAAAARTLLRQQTDALLARGCGPGRRRDTAPPGTPATQPLLSSEQNYILYKLAPAASILAFIFHVVAFIWSLNVN